MDLFTEEVNAGLYDCTDNACCFCIYQGVKPEKKIVDSKPTEDFWASSKKVSYPTSQNKFVDRLVGWLVGWLVE